tara:strand:+ start:6201 stop:6839 length:639 start_codon:yes stop_codon:yes gene_type:complete
MPKHASTLAQTSQKLGSIIDDLIDEDLENSELAAISDISALIVQNLSASRNARLSYLLGSTPSGYVAGKMFDTNVDASNLKTIGTMAVGSMISGGLSTLIGAFSKSTESRNTTKSTAAVILDAEQALLILAEKGKISNDTASEGRKAINDAVASLQTVNRIVSAVLTLESIATAYHGYRRNGDSIGYGLAWGITNGVGLGVALAQGYAKPIV